MLLNRDFMKGYIMGLQETVTDTSLCYIDLINLIDFVWAASASAVNVDVYEELVNSKGQVASDSGFLVQLQETGLDGSLLFFNMYESCYITNLLMLFGNFTQDMSGAFNYTTTIFYEFQSYQGGSEDSMIKKILDAVSSFYGDYNEACEHVGYYLGSTLSVIFEFSIPVFQVNQYEYAG